MDGIAAGSLSGSQKDELMDQVKQQIAVANAQELLTVSSDSLDHVTPKISFRIAFNMFKLFFQKMTEKCFKKCINKPGTTLDSSEQKCVAMCMDRYMDSWNLVSRAYSSRLQKERHRL
uniref:Mitochondrial import inner membrane translocase subunit n=1 Tax=Timema poppense TaxID=170557 RepID=A0A7R9DBS5_TIMPO|nr:unnamed protein product [Timema poppensis]